MKPQSPPLQYLARNDLYFVQPLIPAEQFLTFCTNREMQASVSQLERLDRSGFFRPIARFKRRRTTIKLEHTADGLKDLGPLKNGETWAGETYERTSVYSGRDLHALYDQGEILEPECMPTNAWNSSEFINLYSIFQCYPLWKCLSETRIVSPTIDELVAKNDQELGDAVVSVYKILRSQMPEFKITLQALNDAAWICQAISNRYYPVTQTDQRTIKISSVAFGWDWHEYCGAWNAKQIADEMGLAPDEIFHMWRRVDREASSVNPLRDWDDLLRFVSVEEKQRLRGKALLADSLRSMATMLALFYEGVSGKLIQPSFSAQREILLPQERTDGTLRELEYVVNKYHLNPRPRLILVVEGESEVDQIPRLMDLFWGFNPSKVGIEILNLKGISNFTGSPKRDDGPLKRFIDDYHNRQTIVYILLDNEGGAVFAKNNLLTSVSAYFEKRAITKDEYIRIWNLNYEFDNFTDGEIAKALSSIGSNVLFTEQEIKEARQNFQNGNVLGRLFQSRTSSPLSKRALGNELTALLIAEADSSKLLPKRPILDFLHTIIELAALNHQPTSGRAWAENQRSGYFGNIIP